VTAHGTTTVDREHAMQPALPKPATLTPSAGHAPSVAVRTEATGGVLGVPVPETGSLPASLGVDRSTLEFSGFTGAAGQTLVLPGEGSATVAVGIGDPAEATAATIRDAAAAFALAVSTRGEVAMVLPTGTGVAPAAAAQAVVEGVLLARYRYEALKHNPTAIPVTSLTVVATPEQQADAERGAAVGAVYVKATSLARDLANSPPGLLTAERIAEIATTIAGPAGLEAKVFDKQALSDLGCGGLLGVNAGSADPPTMIKLTYRPPGTASGHLSLVGKGIMYDSGGLSLKPGDEVHAAMKNDMSGAGAILAAMSVMAELKSPTAITAFLMCTDNMPSGSAMKLGDVLSVRGGTTVEVINTDAEGRLVMSDALVLANEETTDAIVDIATLTGACLRALGPDVAGVFGTDQGLVDQVLNAAGTTGEPAWQLPLDRRYRKWLDSPIADIKNVGGATAGAITAALFLSEFVGDTPWAHIDIAGTAQNDVATSWRPVGCTGFGARLLLDLARNFTPDRLGSNGGSVAAFALTGVSPS
jgi:leucyl aminopeptidase